MTREVGFMLQTLLDDRATETDILVTFVAS